MKRILQNILNIIFICILFAGIFTEIAYADVANPGIGVGKGIICLGLIIAVIWVIAYFILKWIRKKNDK